MNHVKHFLPTAIDSHLVQRQARRARHKGMRGGMVLSGDAKESVGRVVRAELRAKAWSPQEVWSPLEGWGREVLR